MVALSHSALVWVREISIAVVSALVGGTLGYQFQGRAGRLTERNKALLELVESLQRAAGRIRDFRARLARSEEPSPGATIDGVLADLDEAQQLWDQKVNIRLRRQRIRALYADVR